MAKDTHKSSGRSPLLLASLLAAGMIFAAYRAWIWPDQPRARQLVVLAPDETRVEIMNGPAPSEMTRGVHSWEVLPGPLTLVIEHSGGRSTEAPITIPKGLGALMLDLRFDEAGDLQIGYF